MFKKLIILFFLISLSLFLTACSQGNINDNKNQNSTKPETINKVGVFYFHSNYRCTSCIFLQKYVEETINEFFQAELRDNKIEFKEVNIDLVENRALTQEFQARGSGLYIKVYFKENSLIEEDIQVWRYLNNEQQFKSYLKNKLNNLLTN